MFDWKKRFFPTTNQTESRLAFTWLQTGENTHLSITFITYSSLIGVSHFVQTANWSASGLQSGM